MALSQSFSMPNLPGMTPDRRSWAYREKEGFKKIATLSSRPSTSHGSRPASPAYERSNIFNNNTFEASSRPTSAHAPLPSLATSATPFGGFVHTPSMTNLSRPSTAHPGLTSQPSGLVRPSTAGATPSASRLPRYVETDKQIARFFGYFVEDRPWDKDGPLGESIIEPRLVRQVILHYYIYDDTLEINEPKTANSGMMQGNFFRRNLAHHDDSHQPVRLPDLAPGNHVKMLGQEFVITDADLFTRDYFKKHLGVILPPALKVPLSMTAPDRAIQYATGLGRLPSSSSTHQQQHQQLANTRGNTATQQKSFHTRSTDYLDSQESLTKSHLFLRYDGQVLRFLCVEVPSSSPPYFPRLEAKLREKGYSVNDLSPYHGFVASASVPRFAFSYYLAYRTMDVIAQRRRPGERGGATTPAGDEPKTVLKKTAMPKNWRDVQSRGVEAIPYTVEDFSCGGVLDIYGRRFLLVTCDAFTRQVYASQGMDQVDVPLVEEEEDRVVQPIPEAGDGFLPIGSPEDTLATVYGMPKPGKNIAKRYRNQGRYLRAKAVLLTTNPIDAARSFLLTFYLEDDTLQVYEEGQRNSGIATGTFLKRGKYRNELAGEGGGEEEVRGVLPTDMYLGNVLVVQGYQFQIVEMDNLSLKFCETYPDEFPLSDTFRILGMVMLKVVERQMDLRVILSRADVNKKGVVDQETFLQLLDRLGLCEELNDQELLTLLRRFTDPTAQVSSSSSAAAAAAAAATAHEMAAGGSSNSSATGSATHSKRQSWVYLQEMADLISHVYYQHQCSLTGGRAGSPSSNLIANKQRSQSLDSFGQFCKAARARTIQWRRTLRKEPHTESGMCTLAVLEEVFHKNGMDLPDGVVDEIARLYRVPDRLAEPILQELHRRHASSAAFHGLDDKVQPKLDRKQSSVRKRLMSSAAIAAKLNELKRKTAAHSTLFRRQSTNGSAASEASIVEESRHAQRSNTLIDYNRLCNDIYICDWLYA